MNGRNLTRRKFCQLAGSGLLALPGMMHAQAPGGLTAREVVARIRKNIGIPWRTPTADTFKIGDPDAPITGIATTFMSTLDVLKRSVAAGHNFVITHEPTFWSADDVVRRILRDDPLYRYKVDFWKRIAWWCGDSTITGMLGTRTEYLQAGIERWVGTVTLSRTEVVVRTYTFCPRPPWNKLQKRCKGNLRCGACGLWAIRR